MANTLKVNPAELKAGAVLMRKYLDTYETQYNDLLTLLDNLDIDDTQRQAIASAAASMKKQFNSMKTYLTDGIIELFETAADVYEEADSWTLPGGVPK